MSGYAMMNSTTSLSMSKCGWSSLILLDEIQFISNNEISCDNQNMEPKEIHKLVTTTYIYMHLEVLQNNY